MMDRLRVLFVCSRNQWRSPTAEAIYRQDDRLQVRSAGLSPQAAHVISWTDIEWAELVLVMESEHKRRLVDRFASRGELPQIRVLDIPDEFQYMAPELVDLLHPTVELVLDEWMGEG